MYIQNRLLKPVSCGSKQPLVSKGGGSETMTTLVGEKVDLSLLIGSCRHSCVDKLLDAFHRAAEQAQLEEYFGCFAKNG